MNAPQPTSASAGGEDHHKEKGLFLAALGVVYGDIGTSPLYAMRECFAGSDGMRADAPNVLGVLSLVFWSMFLTVSVKYLMFVLRADNRGEGGMFALTALVMNTAKGSPGLLKILSLLGVTGAALIYADATITPAISVLSAVEGLEKLAPGLHSLILPLAAGIVVALFAVQFAGTAGVGRVFGPVMLLWFATLGIAGLTSALPSPEVLRAVNPLYAARFLWEHSLDSFHYLGSIFLVVTGCEALYADMAHFGRNPIRRGWMWVVFPGLMLNYFGQGAILLESPEAAPTLFFETVPSQLLLPLVVLSCAATVIASQAMISGAFSLTRQAVQLGFSPRLEIRQTSSHIIGQVYLPLVNWALLLGVLTLMFTFRTSSSLAGAYGVAVSSAMLITSILIVHVAKRCWGWSNWAAGGLFALVLIPDLAFFYANLLKIPQGGWFPLVMATGLGIFLTTWKRGRTFLREKLGRESLPLDLFLEEVRRMDPHRVEGTAVFLTGNPSGVPVTLLHNYKHNKVLHERVVLLNVRNESVPKVEDSQRSDVATLGRGFHVLTIRYGFSESPNLPAAMAALSVPDLDCDPMKVTYFVGRETLVVTDKKVPGFPRWRKRLFLAMSRNAEDATKFFGIPPNRVIELGVQVEL